MKNEDFEKAYNSAVNEGFDPEGKYKEKLKELWDQDLPQNERIEAVKKMLGVDKETFNILSDPDLMAQIKGSAKDSKENKFIPLDDAF